jgi:hypothetical protein
MFAVMDFIQFAQDAEDLSICSIYTKCCVDSLYIIVSSEVYFIRKGDLIETYGTLRDNCVSTKLYDTKIRNFVMNALHSLWYITLGPSAYNSLTSSPKLRNHTTISIYPPVNVSLSSPLISTTKTGS